MILQAGIATAYENDVDTLETRHTASRFSKSSGVAQKRTLRPCA
jgi:hypothetical protein